MPVVETSLGAVRGFEDQGVRVHRAIPFAAPPVGPLRFAAPQPASPWSGERDGLRFGPAPPQPVDGLSRTLGLLGPELETDEDCLTLNVHAPAAALADGDARPVMVWLHGGAFLTGASSGPVYDGRALARAGDVVVVTLNYRVGALGFLALEGAPANRGLLDQIAALRFIRDEIHAFGGDPARVTVFGESAGAGSLCCLLAMPAARGLFHRAIVQSAAPEGLLDPSEAQARSEILAGELALANPSLDDFRKVPVDPLIEAQAACAEPGPRRIGMFFAPVVGGEDLPRPPLQAVADGCADDVALIVTTTAQEMQLYHLMEGFPALPDEALRGYVQSRLPAGLPDAAQRAAALVDAYAKVSDDPLDRFFAVETDASLWVPATRLAAAHSARTSLSARTWMARFDWTSPLREGRLGACHALDVPFTLGNHGLAGVRAFAGEGADADAVAAWMAEHWARFAATGDPDPAGKTGWGPYDVARRATWRIAAGGSLEELPRDALRRLWTGEEAAI